MLSDKPVNPMDIHDKYIANWQARLGQPAAAAASELARSQGVEYHGTRADNTKSFSAYGTQLQQQYDNAPKGPAGDAVRAATLEQIKAFRRLQQLDAESKRLQGLKEQSKGGSQQQEQPQQPQSSGPLTGPRK
jgi:negative regulator of sigma E activity